MCLRPRKLEHYHSDLKIQSKFKLTVNITPIHLRRNEMFRSVCSQMCPTKFPSLAWSLKGIIQNFLESLNTDKVLWNGKFPRIIIYSTIVYRKHMVRKSIIFTFCLIKSWSHDQSETFSATSWKKSEINMRPSDLCDNLHTALRIYKNNYTVRTTQE